MNMELIDKQIWNGLSRTLNFSSSNQYDSFQYNQCCKVSSSALSNKYSSCFYRFLARFSGKHFNLILLYLKIYLMITYLLMNNVSFSALDRILKFNNR
jgi:hypothetical protein